MKKIINIVLGATILIGALCLPFLARGIEVTAQELIPAQQLIHTLKQQIEQLRTQIAELQNQLSIVKQSQQEVKKTLKLVKQLKSGMTSEEIKLLQEILATDPEIYPEGLITGYFGALTQNAVKRFQKKACLDQVGQVGPKTLARINELLTEGAGESGKVPPGLLIAPGIQKKFCGATFQPQPGQILPPGIQKKIETATPSTEGVNPIIW